MIKKLIYIQVTLILLQIASFYILFWNGPKYYNNRLILKHASDFRPRILIVDKIDSSPRATGGGSAYYAIGTIENEKKTIFLGYGRDPIKYGYGDSIYVWSRKGSRVLLPRKKNEKQFNRQEYKDSNKNIILFIFIPIVGIWIAERIVTKKIKHLKNKDI